MSTTTINGPVEARVQERPLVLSPAVDIVDEGERIVLLADMPGVKHDGVEVTLERGQLAIIGRRPASARPELRLAQGDPRAREYRRTFTLGADFDADAIEAVLSHGVLRLVLPKSRPAQRKIEVVAE